MTAHAENPARRRLYGRSKGRPLRRRQAELLGELLPRLTLDLSQPAPEPAALFESDDKIHSPESGAASHPTPAYKKKGQHVEDLWLEIGFGSGEHLTEAAARHRNVGFIGCEPFVNGMAKLLARIEALGLSNIRLHRGDALDAIEWLPERSVGRIFLFYPDPWPKRRHRKRRFVSPATLEKLARVMKPGAELRVATDIDAYASFALAQVRESAGFAWVASSAAAWTQPWEGWTRTKYEAKAIAAGRKPVYLTFRRTAAPNFG